MLLLILCCYYYYYCYYKEHAYNRNISCGWWNYMYAIIRTFSIFAKIFKLRVSLLETEAKSKLPLENNTCFQSVTFTKIHQLLLISLFFYFFYSFLYLFIIKFLFVLYFIFFPFSFLFHFHAPFSFLSFF